MAYLNRRPARPTAGSAELVGLLLVLVAGVAAAWVAARTIGVDLSGVSQVASFMGFSSRVGRPPAVAVGVPRTAAIPSGARVIEATAQAPAYCQPGQTPQLASPFAALKQRLGDTMGTPLECEHVNAENGDTVQETTTGLAVYRKRTGTPTFTNGWAHWALTERGLVTWEGERTDPPAG